MAEAPAFVERKDLYIEGEWVPSQSRATIEVIVREAEPHSDLGTKMADGFELEGADLDGHHLEFGTLPHTYWSMLMGIVFFSGAGPA